MSRGPKVRRIDLEHLGDLLKALDTAAVTVAAAREFAMKTSVEANEKVDHFHEIMRKHTERTDLRPRANFRPTKDNHWTVSLGNQVYSLGPYPEMHLIDDDDARFWWQYGDTKRPVRSMFMALVAIVQHFCNVESEDDGPSVVADTQDAGDAGTAGEVGTIQSHTDT